MPEDNWATPENVRRTILRQDFAPAQPSNRNRRKLRLTGPPAPRPWYQRLPEVIALLKLFLERGKLLSQGLQLAPQLHNLLFQIANPFGVA